MRKQRSLRYTKNTVNICIIIKYRSASCIINGPEYALKQNQSSPIYVITEIGNMI